MTETLEDVFEDIQKLYRMQYILSRLLDPSKETSSDEDEDLGVSGSTEATFDIFTDHEWLQYYTDIDRLSTDLTEEVDKANEQLQELRETTDAQAKNSHSNVTYSDTAAALEKLEQQLETRADLPVLREAELKRARTDHEERLEQVKDDVHKALARYRQTMDEINADKATEEACVGGTDIRSAPGDDGQIVVTMSLGQGDFRIILSDDDPAIDPALQSDPVRQLCASLPADLRRLEFVALGLLHTFR
ncbi:hypothetical protein J8273_8299 [Carpediemonas membranifera]|uniref:Kinetochore protein SPC25 n=1 Tax=Carpediemonas membranifera TaxID=201153 RepID=A0A8J6AYC7_9EUKA|nr:hypothetical protein J8273_8299 [Carpediemonas membranifera]|eukprot:KAG9390259.1 hypothetical protein J8273_8299 [Carpediemonas membranifera]